MGLVTKDAGDDEVGMWLMILVGLNVQIQRQIQTKHEKAKTSCHSITGVRSPVGQVREWRGAWMDRALASEYRYKYEDITTNTSTNTNIKKIQIQIQMKMQIQIQKVQW